ncbi:MULTISPECIES: alpha/beta fold hydrolase [unclassified Sphingobium]|uniref:alpha/beta fold hydrolase n=1 Tax=unclassified Sphingobium TaxID=2611147 RepID=UPI0035A58FEF
MDNSSPRRHMVEIAGSTLSVIDEGEGPAVLLGHGYLWDWRMWEPQIEALKNRYRLIVPEMWGHGQSGPLPEGTTSHADIAAQMLSLLDRLEIDRAIVAGSSMGGMWGAHLAALAPDRIAGLALMNTYLGDEPAHNRAAYYAMLDAVEHEGLVNDAIIATIAPLFFASTANKAPQALEARLRDQVASYDAERLRRSIAPLGRIIFGREDAIDLLDKLTLPALIVAGRDDRSRPATESIIMADRLGVTAHIIDDCGHSATLEQPAIVTDLLARFLARVS